MERGFIKLWRKLKDSKCYSRGGVHRALLLTLFTEANWKVGHFRGEDVLPGQWATSVLGLSQELGFARTTVQRALADLATDGVITVENMGNRWTRITLVNWQCYQPLPRELGQPAGNERATDGQPAGIIKEVKNINTPSLSSLRSERDSPKGGDSHRGEAARFYPPTVGEVQAYCESRGNRIDAQAFVDFYTSKGWKVGKNPMKDWRAAVRTWERKQGEEDAGDRPPPGYSSWREYWNTGRQQ
jgi:hypothetical protein